MFVNRFISKSVCFKKQGLLLSLLVAFSLLVFLAFYCALAVHSYPSDNAWFFDFIEGEKIFFIDDAYRYYEGRAALYNFEVWSWVYMLPADLAYKALSAWVSGGDIVWMRIINIFVNIFAAYVFYAALLRASRPALALSGMVALLAMPLYFSVVISFFGESFLVALVCFWLYFHVSEKNYHACIVAAAMPLVQPEGLFLILPYVLMHLFHKRWAFTAIVLAPGFLYFVFILSVYGGRIDEYLRLHFTITTLYQALPGGIFDKTPFSILVTLNPVLCSVSVLGLLWCYRVIGILYLGGIFWVTFYALVVMPLQGYEARFLVPTLPLLIFSVVQFLETLRRYFSVRKGVFFAKLLSPMPILFMIFIVVENLGQMDPIRENFLGGKRWPTGENLTGMRTFLNIKSKNSAYGSDMAGRVQGFLSFNEDYRWLIVQDHDFFYYLDPSKIREDVRVCFLPFKTLSVYYAFENHFFCMSPDNPRVGFFRITDAREPKAGRALLVGNLSLYDFTPAYENHRFRVYEISYFESGPPERMNIMYRDREAINSINEAGDGIFPKHIYPDW